jgi:large subunit ribosomal protein L4
VKVKVQTLDAQGKGDIELNDSVFGLEPRADILHRVVTWQLEKARGTARGARERSDVARTGKKFGRQKGGGTARHGDRRAPIFIGGGLASVTSIRRSTRRSAHWASAWRCRRRRKPDS